jgi:putative flippase GtrA
MIDRGEPRGTSAPARVADAVGSSGTFASARRFVVSGVSVTALHFAVALLLIERARATPAVANSIAFAIATAVSYVLNTRWSFAAALGARTLTKFLLVSAIGLVLAATVSWLAQQQGLSSLTGICLVACTVAPATFTLHKFWTYGDPAQGGSAARAVPRR